MTQRVWTRRRVLGAALASAAAPRLAAAVSTPRLRPYRWRGLALGAVAQVTVRGPDARHAAELAPQWMCELRRLDRIFSLYREDSALSRLNRAGGLDAPPPELVELLSTCRALHRATAGAFDPSVQPLWELYAAHFGGEPSDGRGPRPAERARAFERIGFSRVRVSTARIEFERHGMGLTLNGIAQGFLTDRIAAMLARAGIHHALVDIGEISAVGPREDGSRWRVGLERAGEGPRRAEVLEIGAGALATTSPAGYRFGANPAHHHLFDPRSGTSAAASRAVTVTAPSATLADGLSTAFSMLGPDRVRAIALGFPGVATHFHSGAPDIT